MGYSAIALWGPAVNHPPHLAIRHLVVIGFFAGVLAACGVKGELEPPPTQAQIAPQSEQIEPAAKKVFTEKSVVKRGSNRDILPKMPPAEWEKYGKDYQPTAAPKSTKDAEKPDRPFILDSLL